MSTERSRRRGIVRAGLLAAGIVLGVGAAHAELYNHAMRQHEDTRAQSALETFSAFFGTPFLGVRSLLAVPGAAAAELGNGLLLALDKPLPGTIPHAEPGWLWDGALRSLGEDWNEVTPGLGEGDAATAPTP